MPKLTEKRYHCDVCGYLTIREKRGNEICPVCFWEDDEWFEGGGTNRITLAEAKANYAAYGAVEQEYVGDVRKPTSADTAQTTAGTPASES